MITPIVLGIVKAVTTFGTHTFLRVGMFLRNLHFTTFLKEIINHIDIKKSQEL